MRTPAPSVTSGAIGIVDPRGIGPGLAEARVARRRLVAQRLPDAGDVAQRFAHQTAADAARSPLFPRPRRRRPLDDPIPGPRGANEALRFGEGRARHQLESIDDFAADELHGAGI